MLNNHERSLSYLRLVCVSVVSMTTPSVGHSGSSSKNQVILAAGLAMYGTLSRITSSKRKMRPSL